jgi:hypothetical protein
MIQKISDPGAGFRGALNYVLAARKEPELIGGNMAGESARELAAEFGHGRARNAAVGKPVFHASLTAAPGDQLSEQDWRRLAERYLQGLGYGESQWVLVRHHDTAHDHVHILANRVDSHGKRVPDFQERKRGEAIVRELEREMGLTPVAPSREGRRRAPGRGELAAFERTGEVSVKARLQEHVDLAARGGPGLAEFAERLSLQGVGVRAHVASTERLSGLSFELEGVSCKGSDLGRGYSWRGLAERAGLSYEPARDLARLRALGAVRGRDVAGSAAPEGPAVEVAEAVRKRTAAAPAQEAPAALLVPAVRPGEREKGPVPAAPAIADPLDGVRGRVRAAVDVAAQGGPTLPELIERLRAVGVAVRPNLASTGRLSGLRFESEGVALKGSELGREYSWQALAGRHGVTFEAARDLAKLGREGQAQGGGPAAGSVQPVAAGVPVYRAAAVLTSRLEVEARVAALGEMTRGPVEIAEATWLLLDRRALEERLAGVQPAALAWGLQAAYGSPDAAGLALAELMAREGGLRAAEILERSPERLGRLRGVGVGGLRNAARREALAGAAWLGRELRTAAEWEARLAEEAPAAAAARTRGEAARGELRQISAAMGLLPRARSLEAEMVRAAEVLGPRRTARLAPAGRAEGLLRRALRTVLNRVRGRGEDLSPGL